MLLMEKEESWGTYSSDVRGGRLLVVLRERGLSVVETAWRHHVNHTGQNYERVVFID
jgi:hypothetical protein